MDKITMLEEISRCKMHLEAWGLRGVSVKVKKGKIYISEDILETLTPQQREVLKI